MHFIHRTRKNRKQFFPVLTALAGLTLLLVITAAVGSGGFGREGAQTRHWQLVPKAVTPDFSAVSPGFKGLAFYDDDFYDSDSVCFRLSEDTDTAIQYAYVPAEMTGALHLCMNEGCSLHIENGSEEDLKGSDYSAILSSAKVDDGQDAPVQDAAEVLPADFRAGDVLPVFSEGKPYSFTVTGGGEQAEQADETKTVVFFYTENVPSMYINTESGSMDAINKSSKHETSENAEYRIYLTDGTPDAGGQCTIKGRGNSTWAQKKRPYNLKLDRPNTLLGMEGCTKYALIANFWDSTQTRQYYAFKAAKQLALDYTPEEQFVNLYLNGRYQSLYLLTQRINVNGGTTAIRDLDRRNQQANFNEDYNEKTLETVVMDTDEDGLDSLALAWKNEPDDVTGGYLIEFNNRYSDETYWFETKTRHMSFKSPKEPSVGEYEYITSYIREAEAALFQTEDAPAGNVWDYFDMESWARMYLIQDFFVQSDDEFYSFYFYKEAGDPLLYCGPVWDFDLSLGSMNCGDYYRTSAQTLWLRDGRKRWLHQMDHYPEFRARVAEIYLEELEPIIRNLLEKEYNGTVDRLEKVTNLNYLRWHKHLNYRERTDMVRELLETRVQFLHDYYTDPGSFHRLLFHFAWDDFSYYVRDGESMGFLPTAEYGEKQSSPQVDGNGYITGWMDTATGTLLQPGDAIFEDREFDPVYQ